MRAIPRPRCRPPLLSHWLHHHEHQRNDRRQRRDRIPTASTPPTAGRTRPGSSCPPRRRAPSASSFFCRGATKNWKASPEMPNRISDQRIQRYRASAGAGHRKQHTRDDDGHDARQREPAVAVDHAFERLHAGLMVPTTITMKFPEHTGDDVAEEQHHAQDVQGLQDEILHHRFALAIEPHGETRRVEFEVLVEYRVDGLVAERDAMCAQAGERPGAQPKRMRRVSRPVERAMRTNTSMASYMSLARRAHWPLRCSESGTPARTELHDAHDRCLELRRIELRRRGGGHDPRPRGGVEFAVREAEGVPGENAGGAVVDDAW